MIGNDSETAEVSVSQSHPEEPDPLLAFSAESAEALAGPPAEPAAQPIVASAVPAFLSPPPLAEFSTERVELIEQALEQSKSDIVLLTSQVTTLVGSIADMNKQLSRMRAPAITPRARMTPVGLRGIAALFALAVGLAIATATWRYLGSEVATAEPVAQAAQVTPPPQTVALDPAPPIVTTTPPPQGTPQLASVAVAPPLPKRVQYVGTLSIDATPGGEVFIDRKPAGRTPLRVPNLRAGSHLVWIERDGYRRWTRVVNVPADRVSRVSADLESIAAR